MNNPDIKYEIFNKISFCPNCKENNHPLTSDLFLYYDFLKKIHSTVTVKRVIQKVAPIEAGFTPHIIKIDKVIDKEYVSYFLICSICESGLIYYEGKYVFDIKYENVSKGIMSIEKWNGLYNSLW